MKRETPTLPNVDTHLLGRPPRCMTHKWQIRCHRSTTVLVRSRVINTRLNLTNVDLVHSYHHRSLSVGVRCPRTVAPGQPGVPRCHSRVTFPGRSVVKRGYLYTKQTLISQENNLVQRVDRGSFIIHVFRHSDPTLPLW